MVAVKNFLLFAVPALSAAIAERQQSTIAADLKTVDTDVNTLYNAVQAFDGTASKGLTVQNAYSQLDKDIKSATTRANNSPVLSSADSKTDIAYINSPLEPDVKKSVNALIAKKSSFVSGGFQSTVCDDLKTLYTDTNAYATALVSKSSSDQTSNANAAKSKVLADIQSGINAFC